MRISTGLAATFAAITLAPAANAATTIEFTNITGTWFDVNGGSNINTTGQGTAHASLTWGNPSGGTQKSGYDFDAISIAPVTIDPVTNESGIISIGQFTHFNYPIASGTGITSAKLDFNTDVTLTTDSGTYSLGNVNFIYAFDHFETPNSNNPCANGGWNNTGVNINGCADRVAVNFAQESGSFVIDGIEYALDVSGFLVGTNPVDKFWTIENKTNTAYIQGQVKLRELAGVGEVPEPSAWALMILGFGAIGMVARRRRRTGVSYAF